MRDVLLPFSYDSDIHGYWDRSKLERVVVKSVIEMHHGSIELISAQGEGTEFVIRLPMVDVTVQKLYFLFKLAALFIVEAVIIC